MGEEEVVDLELCCEGLEQAIDAGAIVVTPHGDGYAVGVLCGDGKTMIRINYCPFCGSPQAE